MAGRSFHDQWFVKVPNLGFQPCSYRQALAAQAKGLVTLQGEVAVREWMEKEYAADRAPWRVEAVELAEELARLNLNLSCGLSPPPGENE